MKKFLLSVLLCVTFGLIVPLTALAADAKSEEAEYMLQMSRQVMQEITGMDAGMMDMYIAEFEAQKQTVLAKGLQSLKELTEDIGPVKSVSEGEVRETEDGYISSFELTCESGRTARATLGLNVETGAYTQLTFDKNQTVGEKMQSGAFNLVVGMGTVFCVLIFISFIISQFKHVNAWSVAQEKVKKEEEAYYAKVEAAKKLPAVSKNVSKRISADAVRAAMAQLPEGTVVKLIEGDEPEEAPAVEAAAPAEPVMDGQLLAVLAAAIAASEAPDPQLIAVITAAIQEFEGNNAGPDGLVVRSIRRVSGRRR
ncbi:MAG: OadG family protein [Stomatobaculum sp.]|nr:OadG family protein [Stomatobaculum sp.]